MAMEINGKTKVCALIGHPAEHTLSPLMHNTLAKRLGIDMVYTAFDVEEADLADAIRGAYALGIHGLNITVPHKQAAMEHCVSVSDAARRIGAVNTLVRGRKKDGYTGDNTDAPGLKRALLAEGITVSGEDVIVIGAGGAARAVLMVCAAEKAKRIWLLNRTVERADRLAAEIAGATGYNRIEVMSVADHERIRLRAGHKAVCFQCTGVGMYPLTENAPIEDAAFFDKVSVVFDLIYRPQETRFMRMAREAGCTAYNGLKMLLYQGIESFERWFDVTVDDETAGEALEVIERNLTEKKTIVLTGFMGSGKSTIARLLSDLLDERLLDLDSEIEQRVQTTISDIFAVRGEEAFRAIESRILQEVARTEQPPFILSTGGGVPLRDANRKLMRELGTVVYLKTSPEEVFRRVQGDDSRPLLQTDDPFGTIESLGREREEYYRLVADFTIVTDGREPEDIAGEIVSKVFPE